MNESPSEFMARKQKEREQFSSQQDADFKVKILTEYAAATQYWKIEPHDQKERAAWVERLRTFGIELKR